MGRVSYFEERFLNEYLSAAFLSISIILYHLIYSLEEAGSVGGAAELIVLLGITTIVNFLYLSAFAKRTSSEDTLDNLLHYSSISLMIIPLLAIVFALPERAPFGYIAAGFGLIFYIGTLLIGLLDFSRQLHSYVANNQSGS